MSTLPPLSDISVIDAAFVDLIHAFLLQVFHAPASIRSMEITETVESAMRPKFKFFGHQEWAVTVILADALPGIGDTILLAVDNRSGTYAINQLFFQPGWRREEESESKETTDKGAGEL